MRRSFPSVAGILCLAVLTGLFAPLARRAQAEDRGKVGVGIYTGFLALPVLIAKETGIFRNRGLDVQVTQYHSGYLALTRLLEREIDFATASDYAFVARSLQSPDLRIVCSMAKSEIHEIVARRSCGIQRPADLKGKRVGITRNTSSEFFMMMFLVDNLVPVDEVTLLDMPPPMLIQALTDGRLDAILSWDRLVDEARVALGTDAVCWPAQGGQDFYWLLVTRADVLETKPEAVRRMVESLRESEQFIRTHLADSQGFATRLWNVDPKFVRDLWPKLNFGISLDQAMLTALEKEAGWIQESSNQPGKLPNFLHYIDFGALDGVDPQAISIFR